MDISPSATQSYTFIEKYFQKSVETRINRAQFFVRSIILQIIIVGIFMSRTLLYPPLEQEMFCGTCITISLLVVILCILSAYWPAFILIKKRAHDYGSSGNFTIFIYTFFSIVFLLMGSLFFDTPLSNIILLYEEEIFLLISIMLYILGVILLILLFILLFRPGKKEENQYGKAEYAKVSFLG